MKAAWTMDGAWMMLHDDESRMAWVVMRERARREVMALHSRHDARWENVCEVYGRIDRATNGVGGEA